MKLVAKVLAITLPGLLWFAFPPTAPLAKTDTEIATSPPPLERAPAGLPTKASLARDAIDPLALAEATLAGGDGRGVAPEPPETAEEQERLEQEEEAVHRFRIKKHPGGILTLDYAKFLFDHGRYAEAEKQLDECRDPSDCARATEVLRKGIREMLTTPPGDAADARRSEINRRYWDALRPPNAVSPAELAGGPGDEPRSEPAPGVTPYRQPPRIQIERLQLVQWYEVGGAPQMAAEGYARLLTEYADSPYINVEYIRFLVRQGKLAKANEWMAQTQSAYPAFVDEPEWKIVANTLAQDGPQIPSVVEGKLAKLIGDFRQSQPGWSYIEPVFPVAE